MELAGIELYFDDLETAKNFYRDKIGLEISDEVPGHHAQLDSGTAFLCLEKKGTESYPSRDKAVVFIEAPDLQTAINQIGQDNIVEMKTDTNSGKPIWVVFHDPEGHNILMMQSK